MAFYAHTPNEGGQWHNLVDHLQNVSRVASRFASKFGVEEPAYWAGLWHDLGKFSPEFQHYLEECNLSKNKDVSPPASSIPHSIYGAIFSAKYWEFLSFLIAGHHGGLPNLVELKGRLKETGNLQEILGSANKVLEKIAPEVQLTDCLPGNLSDPLSLELFLRMLFSCLVDADFLDTENHFELSKSVLRSEYENLNGLWKKFEENQENLIKEADKNKLNRIRQQIYQKCLDTAEFSQGIFRLTVPTGGGKTRSSMAFAMKHAIYHQLDRIIVAIPYTSIIDQTVDIFNGIFGDNAVLEHHSAVDMADPLDYQSPTEIRRRLAAENWEWPLIVTTTVQLFDSLFHNKPGRCRKLHNIARSVIILDEVQTLPNHLLNPILNVLQELVDNYNVTVLLCTATQPAFSGENPYLNTLSDVREIIDQPHRFYLQLKRVNYEIHKEPWHWERVSEEMNRHEQSMVVVNSRRDAMSLIGILQGTDVFHLSTLLCGAHRREILKEIRKKLERGDPISLVSTQVVEAGVDLDFPVVMRAVGPLDRIVQAAGRCNREGRLPHPGKMVVFTPAEGSAPLGAYRSGMQEAEMLLNEPDCDLHNPDVFERYFHRLYQDVDTDAKKIQDMRKLFNYREVAEKFKLIEDLTLPVVVPYGDSKKILKMIKSSGIVDQKSIRRLQPYMVNIYQYQWRQYQAAGLIEDTGCEIFVWKGDYDPVRGLIDTARDPADLVV